MTPYAALLARMRTDPASPLLTYRDLSTGERMELSAASLGNAIAKTAGLLRDDMDVQPGAVIAIHLPLHWQRAVWLGACAATGAIYAPGLAPEECDVCVVDRAHIDLVGRAPEDVLVSLAPFGLPEPGGAPVGVVDAAVAMRAHPDTFAPVSPPAEEMPLTRMDGAAMSQGDLMDRARSVLAERGVGAGERLAIIDDDPQADVLMLAGGLVSTSGAVVIAHSGSGDLTAVLREEGIAVPAG